ncbi:MAG: TetR/AcrR family transcriptional regulator, partial [Candidatus Odinarchaeota archaeon]
KDTKLLRDRKKDRTRKTILTEAEKLFTEKSYKNVFLDDIAEAAFISRATLYNYFKNKDDVFFAVGNQIYKDLNETIRMTLPAELSGKEQILFLCEKTFKDGIDKPVILKTIQEFLDRINDRNLTTEEIYIDVTGKLGVNTLDNLVENLSRLEEVDLAKYFEEPHFIDFFIQLLINSDLWLKAVQKGKKDNTIKNDLEDMQIVQYISILMNGMLYEMDLRQTARDRFGLRADTIITNSLNLIGIFLDRNV